MLERKLDKLLDKLEAIQNSASPLSSQSGSAHAASSSTRQYETFACSRFQAAAAQLRPPLGHQGQARQIKHRTHVEGGQLALPPRADYIGSVAPSIARDFDHPAYGKTEVPHGPQNCRASCTALKGSCIQHWQNLVAHQWRGVNLSATYDASWPPHASRSWIEGACSGKKGWGKNVPLSIADKVRQCLSSTLMSEALSRCF